MFRYMVLEPRGGNRSWRRRKFTKGTHLADRSLKTIEASRRVHGRERWRPGGAAMKAASKEELGNCRGRRRKRGRFLGRFTWLVGLDLGHLLSNAAFSFQSVIGVLQPQEITFGQTEKLA